MARPAPPSDDGSPARVIAAMVGIVGILLLGSLAWSAVGAFVGAVSAAGSALSSANAPPPTLAPAVAVTPRAVVAADAPTLSVTSTPIPAAPSPTLEPVAAQTPTPEMAATPTVTGRNPWILLPHPEPGGHVSPGQIVVEARGRGDAPITSMRLEMDGAALPVALEQRSESTWRGSASTKVAAGAHVVRATVTDASGRTGSYRWTFSASPAP